MPASWPREALRLSVAKSQRPSVAAARLALNEEGLTRIVHLSLGDVRVRRCIR